jgi:hypothetical protein
LNGVELHSTVVNGIGLCWGVLVSAGYGPFWTWQCGGQGFESPQLHSWVAALRSRRIAWSEGFSDAVDDRDPVDWMFISVHRDGGIREDIRLLVLRCQAPLSGGDLRSGLLDGATSCGALRGSRVGCGGGVGGVGGCRSGGACVGLVVGSAPWACARIRVAAARPPDPDVLRARLSGVLLRLLRVTYEGEDMNRPDAGDLSLTRSAARIDPTEVLRYYVISVDENGYALFRSQLGSRSFAAELPPGAHVVSNQLAITKPSSQSATSTTTSYPATSTTPSQTTAAVIVYPPDNAAVPQTIAAKGTVANLRSGYALFLVLDYDGCYFVQLVHVDGPEWSTEMDIGGVEVASGHEFTLSAVTTDQDLTQAQRKQVSGCFTSLDDLKEKYGVVVLTTNQIKRK